jgi:hypothetical protein
LKLLKEAGRFRKMRAMAPCLLNRMESVMV